MDFKVVLSMFMASLFLARSESGRCDNWDRRGLLCEI